MFSHIPVSFIVPHPLYKTTPSWKKTVKHSRCMGQVTLSDLFRGVIEAVPMLSDGCGSPRSVLMDIKLYPCSVPILTRYVVRR